MKQLVHVFNDVLLKVEGARVLGVKFSRHAAPCKNIDAVFLTH